MKKTKKSIEVKTTTITVKVSESEKKKIEKAARRNRVAPSTHLRNLGLADYGSGNKRVSK